jgi:hypothetical protein
MINGLALRWTCPRAGIVVLSGFLVAACGGAGPSAKSHTSSSLTASTTSSTSPASTSTTATSVAPAPAPLSPEVLSIVRCPTTFGVTAPPTTAQLPTSVTVTVPSNLGVQLTAYSDDHGLVMLIGPLGWSCSAAYGADGSGGVIVFPAGEQVPVYQWGAGWTLAASSSDEAISATQTSASPVLAATQACAFFAPAATAYEADLGRRCPAGPAGQTTRSLSPSVVSFADPPGIHGAGIPSGGQYPADGVVTDQTKHPALPGSYLATCTLPTSQSALCVAVLDNVSAWYEPTAPSTNSAATAGSPVLTIGKWTGREPAAIYFSGDAGDIATGLSWSSWTSDGAVGHGMRNVLGCVPDCAQGTVTAYPVTITLSRPVNGAFTFVDEQTADGRATTETFSGSYLGQGACTTSAQSSCLF